MNANTLRARLTLSFKGETHDLETVVDLDNYSTDLEEAPNFHLLLAQAAGIDPYSYLYEVLESDDIEFSDATGLATQCCHEGCFDWAKFARMRRRTATGRW